MYGFVHLRVLARLQTPDRLADPRSVARQRHEDVHLVLECYDGDAVARAKLVDERQRRCLDQVELLARRPARVQHERHVEGLVDGCEEGDIALLAILVDREVRLAQIGNVAPSRLTHDDGNFDEHRLELDDLFLSRWRWILSVLNPAVLGRQDRGREEQRCENLHTL